MKKQILIFGILVLILVLPLISSQDAGLPINCGGSDSELIFGCGFEGLIFLSGEVPKVSPPGIMKVTGEPREFPVNLLIIVLPIVLFFILIMWFFIAKRKGKKTKEIIP